MTPALLALLLLAQAPDPEALSDQALEMARQNRFEQAEKLWRQALKISPTFFPAAFNLGYMHYSRGDYAGAEPWLARAAAWQPKDFNARFLLGAALVRLGRTDDALRHWRAALEIRPGHRKLLQMMAVEYGKGRYFREAAAAAERALALDDTDSNVYLIAIKSYQDAADHASALRIAERFSRKFPDLPRANFEYGYELYRAGRPEDGLPYLKKAMQADQSYEEPFFFYGEILLDQRRFQEAVAPLRKAIAYRPGYMAARTALARALIGLGHLEEAKTELLRAVEIDPRHPQPHLLLSQLYFRLGREDLAAKEKELSLKLRRENPHALEPPQGRIFRSGPG